MTRIARRVGTPVTGTPEWHALRRGAITGSRIAAALGLSPWLSPFALYWQLLGREDALGQEISAPMEWGTRHEPTVIEKFAEVHPEVTVMRRPGIWQNVERPWQMVTPDALIMQPGPGRQRARRGPSAILEVKTTERREHWGLPGTDEIPVYYRCQILWMLDCLGLELCHVAVLFGLSGYEEYVVRYHEDDVAILRRGAVRFLERVEQQDRPDIDGSDQTYELIRRFHPEIDGSTVVLPPDLVEQAAITQAAAAEANEAFQEVRATVAEFMGRAKIAVGPDGSKVADRRARREGTPYVQFVDLTSQPTIAQREAS